MSSLNVLLHMYCKRSCAAATCRRIGGEEFAVLLHDCPLKIRARLLDKTQLAVQEYRLCFGGREYRVGVSIGSAAIDGSEHEASTIVARADAACYAAKSAVHDAAFTR